jgi:hypothetical protein
MHVSHASCSHACRRVAAGVQTQLCFYYFFCSEERGQSLGAALASVCCGSKRSLVVLSLTRFVWAGITWMCNTPKRRPRRACGSTPRTILMRSFGASTIRADSRGSCYLSRNLPPCVCERERDRERERERERGKKRERERETQKERARACVYQPVGRALTYASSGSKCNDMVLDVEGGNPSQGAQVWMFQRNDTNAQKWRSGLSKP